MDKEIRDALEIISKVGNDLGISQDEMIALLVDLRVALGIYPEGTELILNQICEHGCHNHDVYGFVIMAGCPIHD